MVTYRLDEYSIRKSKGNLARKASKSKLDSKRNISYIDFAEYTR